MIKSLFFTAALLVPGLASAGNPSANLSGQIVPSSAKPLLGLAQGDGTSPLFHVWAGRYPDFNANWQTCGPGGACPVSLNNYPMVVNFQHLDSTYNDPIAAANGSYNTAYQQTADILAQYNGQSLRGIYAIRVDSEWHMGFGAIYEPFPNPTTDPNQTNPAISAANWIAGVRNLINIIRGTPGLAGVKIVLESPQSTPQQPYWPGDSYVDLTGIDVYFDPYYWGPTSSGAWDARVSNFGPYNQNFIISAAWGVAHNKPLLIAEWCDGYTDQTDPALTNLTRFAAWMAANNTVAQIYWDDSNGAGPGTDCRLLVNATRQQSYINAFGSSTYTGSYWSLKPIDPNSGY
jgi:hypothetical protein